MEIIAESEQTCMQLVHRRTFGANEHFLKSHVEHRPVWLLAETFCCFQMVQLSYVVTCACLFHTVACPVVVRGSDLVFSSLFFFLLPNRSCALAHMLLQDDLAALPIVITRAANKEPSWIFPTSRPDLFSSRPLCTCSTRYLCVALVLCHWFKMSSSRMPSPVSAFHFIC